MPDALQQKVNDGKRTHNELIARSTSHGRNVIVEDAAHAWLTMDRPRCSPQGTRCAARDGCGGLEPELSASRTARKRKERAGSPPLLAKRKGGLEARPF
jgi:hypothetical protein